MRRQQLQTAAEHVEQHEYEKAREVRVTARPRALVSCASPLARSINRSRNRLLALAASLYCPVLILPFSLTLSHTLEFTRDCHEWQLLGAIEADLRGISVPEQGRVGPKDPHTSTFQVGHIEC